jgi:hypothetical protein
MSHIAKYMLSADDYEFALTFRSKAGLVRPPSKDPGWLLVGFSGIGGFEGTESLEESNVAFVWAHAVDTESEEGEEDSEEEADEDADEETEEAEADDDDESEEDPDEDEDDDEDEDEDDEDDDDEDDDED